MDEADRDWQRETKRATRYITRQRGSPLADVLGLTASVAALAYCGPVLAGVDGGGAAKVLLPALLLLAGAFAGRLVLHLRLPRLTGYLAIGVLLGPDWWILLGQAWPALQDLCILDATQVAEIKVVKELAIGLIALMAGAEIRLAWLRERWRPVSAMVLSKAVCIIPLVAALVVWLPDLFPFLGSAVAAGRSPWQVGLLTGAIVLASSPMVVVSVIKDLRAKGPLSETAMGVAVSKDVVVLVCFSVLISLLRGETDASASGGQTGEVLVQAGGTLVAVFISVCLGVPIGLLLAWVTERSQARVGWLLVGLALAVALLEPVLHVKPLFCLLSAGFAAENAFRGRSARGRHRLEQSLGRVATPVFVMFFVAAGLGLQLTALVASWTAVLSLVLLRFAVFWGAMDVAGRLTGVEPVVRRYGALAMVPQAGVTLGLAAIVDQSFPGWGEELGSIIVACVAIHEFVGPIILTWVLRRSGEAQGGH